MEDSKVSLAKKLLAYLLHCSYSHSITQSKYESHLKVLSNENYEVLNQAQMIGIEKLCYREGLLCYFIWTPSWAEHKTNFSVISNIWIGFAWTNWHSLEKRVAAGPIQDIGTVANEHCTIGTALYWTAGRRCWRFSQKIQLCRSHCAVQGRSV
jgi:hypothetical protein